MSSFAVALLWLLCTHVETHLFFLLTLKSPHDFLSNSHLPDALQKLEEILRKSIHEDGAEN